VTTSADHFISVAACFTFTELPNTPVQDFTRLCVSTSDAPCAATDETWRGYHKLSARSAHPGGVNVMLLDTSIHFVSNQVDWNLWKAVSTFSGEELISEQF
jgi:hypothetical protein